RAGIASQEPRRSKVPAEPDLRICGTKPGVARRNPQIAREAYAKPRAHGVPVHGCDRHFWHVIEQPGKLLHLPQSVDILLESQVLVPSHHPNVAPRAKSSAASCYYNRPDFGIATPSCEHIYRVHDQVAAERVKLVGPVKGQRRDPFRNGRYDVIAHYL